MQAKIEKIILEIRPDLEENIDNLIEEIDSIDIANIIASLEQIFDIEIPIYEISPENFTNISSIEELINSIRNHKHEN